MDLNWYVLHSQPNKEDLLWHQILTQDVAVYYPCIPVHPVNPRSKKIKPYFPGYMFIRVDIASTGVSVFQWMPYATGLVSFGGEPATVTDGFIHLLEQKVGEIVSSGGVLFQNLKKGDDVNIQSGPFAQYAAIFDHRIGGTERVRVLLKMLNARVVPIDLHVGQIEKVKKKNDT
jgi:transcription antitermination factor NusG